MQTRLLPDLLEPTVAERANTILRKCVHCGFCTATCPTYQLLGDELDGPRGRIYQVKQMLEGEPSNHETLMHLDRCLTCRSCETTCPSGVNYAELIDIGRLQAEKLHPRPLKDKLTRQMLGWLLPRRKHNHLLFQLSSKLRPLLPGELKQKTPRIRAAKTYPAPATSSQQTVLLLEGCVQSTLSPNTNAAAEMVLSSLGYQVIREAPVSCCGAVNHHLSQEDQAQQWVLKNLENWSTLNKTQPLHAIVSTASGCGLMLKDYPSLLQHMPGKTDQYADLLDKIFDISELFNADQLRERIPDFKASQQSIAYHAPCTLNHGQKLAERLFNELSSLQYQLEKPANAHLCCGSAGTYSLLQVDISRQLRNNKLQALEANGPATIITANVGCEHHLGSAGDTPVIHWVEQLANDLSQLP